MMKIEDNPQISVIVPFYNGEKYLNQCIDSILNQDYENLEIVLVNDGSKDNTATLLNEYLDKDSRIKVIHQENKGVGTARNMALDCICGDYVCFIDQDDCISKNYISYFYNLIKKNNADISLTPNVNKFKNDISFNAIDLSNDVVEIWDGKKTAMQMLYYNLIIAPWNKMISRDLIEKNEIRFDKRYFGGEGFLFSLECFIKANRVAVGNNKVYNYRCDNPNSGMTKFSMTVIDSSINSQKTIKEKILRDAPQLGDACKYANWHTYCDCLNTMIGCKVTKKYQPKYREVKKVCRMDAICVFKAPSTKKEKIKGLLYFINPYITAKVINHFRLRKFTIEEEK